MDFAPTEEQVELAGLARGILADHVTPERLRAVGDDRHDPELWSALAGAGVLSAALPSSVGGDGLGLLERCSVLVELGRTVAPAAYLPTIAVAAAGLARFGSAAHRTAYAAPAATGQHVLTAALDGDFTATRTPTGWRLTGSAPAVPSAPLATALLLPATAPDGPSVFLVEAADPGVTIERQRTVDLDDAGLVELDGTELPADRLVGDREALNWLRAHATVGLCAHQLGVVERALELTAEYARQREQFGRPIGAFQAVAQRLADGYVDVEAVRLTMWQAAWLLATTGPGDPETEAAIATAKFWAADAGHRVAHTAVHVHGGVGIDVDHPLHRYFIAAKRNEFALGAATEQLVRLAEALLGNG